MLLIVIGYYKKKSSFKLIEHSHIATTIHAPIMQTIHEYHTHDKFFSITLDNASNNNVVAKLLKLHLHPILDEKLFHIRCVCHIMNIIIQDGLKVIESYIGKVRDAIKYILSSRARKQEFKSLCSAYG